MPTEYDNDLLREGILRYKAKEFDAARRYLERALDNADDNETRCTASYYMSKLTDDPVQKRKYLENVLAIDLTHAQARRDLAILDGKLKPEQIVDPDALPAQPAGTQEVRAERFTCPKCGGRMVYSPDGSGLVCEYCSRDQAVSPAGEAAERDFFIALATGQGQRKPVSTVTFQCQGCGARFVLAPNRISATCAYCGSAHVVATDERRDLLEPDAILPMCLDQKQAVGALVAWVKKINLQPESKVQPPHGLYMPVWIFDILGNVPWHGYKIHYEDRRKSNLIDLGLSNLKKEYVTGEYPVQYSNVCVTGTYKLADVLVKLLPEYAFSVAPAYDPRYLAGWPAEINDISLADASLDARKLAVDQIRRDLPGSVGPVQDLAYSASAIQVSGFKLVLVPVWVTSIVVHEKNVPVLINGVTGALHSGLPENGLASWLAGMLGAR
jgi:hypothetical protein